MDGHDQIDACGAGVADPRRLERFFGRPVPASELAIWASIPPAQRDKALQRMTALDRHGASDGAVAAKQAAADAGVKLGRFYQMARAWAERRSLASVGAFASTTRSRQRMEPEIAQALQSAVVGVVASHSDESIATLARLLGEAAGVSRAPNTLRPFVERELRRRAQKELAGEDIQFDCAATSLRRRDGAYHVAFLVIDGGTGLILGHSVGEAARSAKGYAAAAAHAHGRILDALPASGIWAEATGRSQLVPGTDSAAIAGLVAEVREQVGGIGPQLARARSYGRYARGRLGLKIGPVRLLPARTENDAPPDGWNPEDGLEADDAQARLELAAAAHNREVASALTPGGRAEAPDGLARLLEAMARSRS